MKFIARVTYTSSGRQGSYRQEVFAATRYQAEEAVREVAAMAPDDRTILNVTIDEATPAVQRVVAVEAVA